MAGISNYYDGETGLVKDIFWELESALGLFIQIDGNPHRTYICDYGSDICIDPNLKVGQFAMYRKISTYSGLWAENAVFQNLEDLNLEDLETFENFESLKNALNRVAVNREKHLYSPISNKPSVKKFGVFQSIIYYPLIKWFRHPDDKKRIESFTDILNFENEISNIVESSKIPFRWGNVCYSPASPKIQIPSVQLIIPDNRITERLLGNSNDLST